jgi:hypothetical protein
VRIERSELYMFSSSQAERWLSLVENADDPEMLFEKKQLKSFIYYLSKSETGVVVYTTYTPRVAEPTCSDDV